MPAGAQRPSILIVEDEGLIRSSTSEAFELAGWLVFEAASGEAALTQIERQRPSVIFTDISLGGRVTGWDVGVAGFARSAKIFYTSGEAKTKTHLLPNGSFFSKPYDIQAVIKTCRKALGR